LGTKVGQIRGIDRVGSSFVRLVLEGGERVELPHGLMDHVTKTYPPTEILVFVERRGRLFSYVHWAGSARDAYTAEEAGILERREIEVLYQNGRRITGG
jgi:hypothetical protein